MKKYISILCTIVLLISISGIASAEINKNGVNINFAFATDEELQQAIEVIQNELDSRGSKPQNKNNNPTNNGKGDIGVTKTSSSGVSFTVLSIKQSYGDGFYTPADGNVFVQLEVEIANNSSDVVSVNALFGFDAICDDYTIEYSFSADCATDNSLSTADVKPGRKLKGWKAYEVPKNWKELIINYSPELWGKETIEVIIYNK